VACIIGPPTSRIGTVRIELFLMIWLRRQESFVGGLDDDGPDYD
jgi:hypothetical protein